MYVSILCLLAILCIVNSSWSEEQEKKSAISAESKQTKALPINPPKHDGIYVVAHRGLHNGIPENTIPAYQKAIELDVDFVEIDVRTTKDGKFVSIHNDSIDAYVPGKTGKVKDFTLEELRSFDVGSRIGPEWKGTQIPTFEEILDQCKGKCGVYLDLKEAPIAPLVKLIKKRDMESDVIWFGTVNSIEAFKELQKLCPECVPMPDPGPESNLPILFEELKPRVIASAWKRYSSTFAEKCHAQGAIVIMDDSDPGCWEQAIEWGVDGIQTDHPKELIELLEKKQKTEHK